MSDTRQIISKLLGNIGSRAEVDQYLREYSEVDSRKFAVIKVGGGIVRDDLEGLASSLSFLHTVGLYPIVVHGAGPQLDAALREKGIATRREDGMRVTDQETLEVARRVFQQVNLDIVEALEELGAKARPITSGVFDARLLDEERYGYVGEVTRVHLDAIRSAIRSKALPVISCLGETATGQIVNINADVAARELAIEGEPHKMIFLTPTGGILDEDGELIPSINLSEDYDDLMAQPWVSGGMRVKLAEIELMLSKLPLSSSVSITTPAHMARELFTHRGSGTLVRRGERTLTFDSLEGFDQARAKELLESCFGKKLVPGYFEHKEIFKIYVTESYRAIAILTQEDGVPYLDKFGVGTRAQGEGLGRSVWLRMRQENPVMFWRSRRVNPINAWYFKQADGTFTSGRWTVFWYGLGSFDVMRECVEHALAMPATFIEPEQDEEGSDG